MKHPFRLQGSECNAVQTKETVSASRLCEVDCKR